jgi:hypothetical protein
MTCFIQDYYIAEIGSIYTIYITAISQVIYNVQITIHFTKTIFSGFWAHWTISLSPEFIHCTLPYNPQLLRTNMVIHKCLFSTKSPFTPVLLVLIFSVQDWIQTRIIIWIFFLKVVVHSEGRPLKPMHLVHYCLKQMCNSWPSLHHACWESPPVLKNYNPAYMSSSRPREKLVQLVQYEIQGKKCWIYWTILYINTTERSPPAHCILVSTHVRNFLCNRCLALPVRGKQIEAPADHNRQRKRDTSLIGD